MLKWIIIVLGIIFLLVFIEWMREIHTFKVTHYQIESRKLKGLQGEKKIVFLSDLHNCSYGKDNEKLLSVIREEKPDYILCSGDMLVGKKSASTEVAEKFMTSLPKICKVFCVNGNHEERMKACPEIYGDQYQKYMEALELSGVHCLYNETVQVDFDGKIVNIYGLALPHNMYKKFEKHNYMVLDMEEHMGSADSDVFNIVMAHDPSYMDTYLEWGADLAVSGHYHGGVVRLPFVGGMVATSFKLFPKYSGELTKVKDAFAVVSKGIGLHTIRVRLFNPAEVVVLHINSTEE